ncbi:MAG: methionine biosynthesis protein MetW [Acidobacteria bacterium]|nr:methionine biosynthesis protein MetW [Acidobacteriota bacterium]
MATAEAVLSTIVSDALGRQDYAIIGEMVEEDASVLDLGCGEGELLSWLVEQRNAKARGVEISPEKVRKCVARGLSVYQGDIDKGLADYPEQCFDYIILSQTLQETLRPLDVLKEMVRVGRRAIVAFPNFGHWAVRTSLLRTGKAPKTDHLPYEWHNTPNIHFLTVLDFEQTVREEGFTIERSYFLRKGKHISWWRSLRSDVAVYELRK